MKYPAPGNNTGVNRRNRRSERGSVQDWRETMQGKVEICGVNTAKLPVLRGEETRRLLERAQAGDKAAREELISGNLRLVLSVVQKFTNRG